MYTIHADGKVLFDSLSEDVGSIVLSPKLTLDINKAGSCSLVLPPGNVLHGQLKKMKSVLTVEQDGDQLFRGRVTETETDTYNQQNAYCEGDKSFLKDSVFSPGSLSGKVRDFFRNLVNNHNEQVDAEKRFTVGIIDAVGADVELNPESRQETRVCWNTLDMMEDSLLNVYGGYLRTRTVDGAHYLDWVAQYGEENSQPIEFSVNLLDLTAKADAGEVFTVLIPLGASEIGEDGEYTDPLSITSVNGGRNYIQDDAAVALYGKIWRTHTWSYIEDPAKLLERGREYLKTGIALETITLKAIDMHFVDGNVPPIRIGDKVRILSNPHGIDKVLTCTQIEIDLRDPENTVYTFGERPRVLTENVVRAEKEVDGLTGYRGGGGGGRKSIQEEISDIIRWAELFKNEHEAKIGMVAGEQYTDIVEGFTTLKEVGILLNGSETAIGLIAMLEDTRGRISKAGIDINGDIANIKAFVEEDGVITAINLYKGNVTIDADKINLSGYVTASQLSSIESQIGNLISGTVQASLLYTQNLTATGVVRLAGHTCEWLSLNVCTGVHYSKNSDTVIDKNGVEHDVITSVSVWGDYETIDFLGT